MKAIIKKIFLTILLMVKKVNLEALEVAHGEVIFLGQPVPIDAFIIQMFEVIDMGLEL